MDLLEFVKGERGRGASIAATIGVHPVMVSQWAGGVKAVPVERCCDIERATGNAVRRWDLRRADWHRIWPELIGTEGAPAVTEPAAQA
jgi:DNA-binding transcriptional regulator YdaS (Cro superfamily)